MICRATPILSPALLMLIHLAMKPLRAGAKGSLDNCVIDGTPKRVRVRKYRAGGPASAGGPCSGPGVPPSSTPKPKPQGQAEPAGELCVLLLCLVPWG